MISDEKIIEDRKKIEKRNRSLLSRFYGKLRREVWELLTTTTTLEDKTQEKAPKYFSHWNVALIGVFKRALFGGLFLYFFYTVFIQSTATQQFIGASITSGVCEPVLITWNTILYADYNGNWQGTLGYTNNLGYYVFVFSGLELSQEDYSSFMLQQKESIRQLGERAKQQDLAINMLYWSSWKSIILTPFQGTFSVQVMTMSGNPQMIMWNSYVQGIVSSVKADCLLTVSSQMYVKSDATLKTSIDVSSFFSEPSCNTSINPYVLGWDPRVDSRSITLSLDVNALMTAMAVSTKINGDQSFAFLEVISVIVEKQEFRGDYYSVIQTYDPLYPQMSPIFCLGPYDANLFFNRNKFNASDWNCVIEMGNSYGFPIFIHSGANDSYPTPCDCTTRVGLSARCDKFSFLAGVAVYDITSNETATKGYPPEFQPFLPMMELLYIQPVVSVKTGNLKVFNSAFAAIHQEESKSFSNDPEWRKTNYKWCLTHSFSYCSLIMWLSEDPRSTFVSNNLLNIPNGACADSFTSPKFDKIVQNSWANLQQDYYTCFMDSQSAVINAVGIGIGNASVIYSFVVIWAIYFAMGISTIIWPDWRYRTDEEDIKIIRRRDKRGSKRESKSSQSRLELTNKQSTESLEEGSKTAPGSTSSTKNPIGQMTRPQVCTAKDSDDEESDEDEYDS